jgi:hypothetical protein
MSEFLLLGARPPGAGEVSLSRAAHDVMALAAWQRWLRRWGLLRSFALPQDTVTQVRACLMVQASGEVAAERLAARWAQMSGYHVTVLPVWSAGVGEGHRP